jgi:hypothetical protein
MQVEDDYDKEVYNGDLGVVSRIDMEEGELTSMAAISPTALANSMSWYWPSRRRSTRAKARSTQPS